MGFDYGISNRRFPLHNTDGKDRPAAVRSDVTQTVGEVAFTLPTQPGNAMGRYAGQSTMIDIQGTQKFEPVEQTVSSSRVVTNLEVAKPDETTDIAGEHFTQKFVGDREHPLLNFPQSAFQSAAQRRPNIRAQALDCRYCGQNGGSFPTPHNKTMSKILV